MSFPNETRKVVRGGSWKDVAYYLRVSSRDYEYSDTSRSYIGFRTVQDFLGSQKVKIK
jgi:formylglycine-generating enzyme required for sulfatase activity